MWDLWDGFIIKNQFSQMSVFHVPSLIGHQLSIFKFQIREEWIYLVE